MPETRALRPLLKWAGGKRQLLPMLSIHYPAQFDRYVEQFFGSGAVFFDLHARGTLAGRRARLADVNPDLVGCYRTVRDDAACRDPHRLPGYERARRRPAGRHPEDDRQRPRSVGCAECSVQGRERCTFE